MTHMGKILLSGSITVAALLATAPGLPSSAYAADHDGGGKCGEGKCGGSKPAPAPSPATDTKAAPAAAEKSAPASVEKSAPEAHSGTAAKDEHAAGGGKCGEGKCGGGKK